jgi:hypothetical protein
MKIVLIQNYNVVSEKIAVLRELWKEVDMPTVPGVGMTLWLSHPDDGDLMEHKVSKVLWIEGVPDRYFVDLEVDEFKEDSPGEWKRDVAEWLAPLGWSEGFPGDSVFL